jgi:hypothetical protein
MARPPPTNNGSTMLKIGIFLTVILLLMHVALEFNRPLFRVLVTDEGGRSGNNIAVVTAAVAVEKEDLSFSLAYHDSLGFFVDISDASWKERRRIARTRSMYAKPSNPLAERHQAHAFYQMNHEPTLACLNENMLGNMGKKKNIQMLSSGV